VRGATLVPVCVMALLLGSSASYGVLSSNLLPNGDFEDNSYLKLEDSPRTQAEIDAGAQPVRDTQFHPGGIAAAGEPHAGEWFDDYGKWIGQWGISTMDDPRINGIHEPTDSQPHNVSVDPFNPGNHVMEAARFRGGVATIVPAPVNHVAGTASIDFDYYFKDWTIDALGLDGWDAPVAMHVWVYGVPDGMLPTALDRVEGYTLASFTTPADYLPLYTKSFVSPEYNIWAYPTYNPYNPGGESDPTKSGWTDPDSPTTPILWQAADADGLDPTGAPIESPVKDPRNGWNHPMSGGTSDPLPGHPDPGTPVADQWWSFSTVFPQLVEFEIDQAYDYYFVRAQLRVFAEPHLYYFMGWPTDAMGVAIDNIELQVQISVPGDFNNDGMCSLLDINDFVTAIVDMPAYLAAYPDAHIPTIDPSQMTKPGDPVINLQDIPAFVAIVTGSGQVTELPEPASVSVMAAAAVLLLRRRRR